MPKQPKKRRLVKGKDYDRWMYRYKGDVWGYRQYRTKTEAALTCEPSSARLVRVKLVEVEP